jgi:hypothetical protein
MIKRIPFTILLIICYVCSFGQAIDSLKLADSEIPAEYSKSNEMFCVTPHACSLYNQSDLFETFIGKVVKKEFQSFSAKGDKGTIIYFQFEKEFKGQSFLEPLLWGEGKKPSKSEPDDYYAKGNILILWSFNIKSDLKKISKAKVTQLLP